MTTRLNPYISFKDNARQALELYHSVLGGELTTSTFGQNGLSDDPAEADKIMHGMIETTTGFVLMGSDTPSSMEWKAPQGISISISGEDEAELRGYWDGLVAAGATEAMPLTEAPWGDTFGLLVDPFGVEWMINIGGTGQIG